MHSSFIISAIIIVATTIMMRAAGTIAAGSLVERAIGEHSIVLCAFIQTSTILSLFHAGKLLSTCSRVMIVILCASVTIPATTYLRFMC